MAESDPESSGPAPTDSTGVAKREGKPPGTYLTWESYDKACATLREHAAPAFQPGVSGNPGGRRARPVSTGYLRELAKTCDPDVARILGLPFDSTNAEALCRSIVRKAIVKHNVEAAREVREATEGRSPQRIDLGQLGDHDVEVEISYERIRVKTSGTDPADE